MASTQSFTSEGSVEYNTVLANYFQAYQSGTFSARRHGHYYVELCAGAQVTCSLDPAMSFTSYKY